MSQMVTRQRTGGDEKEKRQTDSPVKDMKKKMAANAEKEKNAAEQATSKPAEKPADKAEKPTDKTEKPAEKPAEKPKVAEKPADKKDKAPEKEKPAEKKDKPAEKEKPVEKKDKPAEKEKPVEKKDKPADKKEGQSEKKKEENGKGESSGKTEKPAANGRPKQNGTTNGTSKESKVLKLTDSGKDTPKDKKSDAKSDAKSDGKPEAKSDGKPEAKSDGKSAKTVAKTAETPKKEETIKADVKKDVKESPRKGGKEDKSERVEVEVVVEIENNGDASEESRKPDTNFSKSRVKVSPYRRSMRLADQTTSSIAANYTGNNTTMEMDITESSSFMDETMDDSYLSGLRSIRGRRSYKLLQELPPRGAAADRSGRSVASITVSEQSTRPTAPVVGRKRKPEPEDHISIASEAREADSPIGKRQRLLEKLARPFRKTVLMPARRNAEIVGINTDLPLTAPVASTSRFDPETLKAASDTPAPPAAPPALAAPAAEDAKRCVIM
ncbi:neurofilament heavy polypeptide-like isoform X5 [Cydia pomonella]|uniref:neurofilament heavy polypeptide-like isoform X5 n=1 Tax=Cydia pomonella TaxID=82600 RepID=UPI002ADE3DA5|nr:neurofilament heavy polypeptide-like isoform X5 [Cydia pomonella]